eukprot:CAMPEP_0172398710 /NCGR_PEP_ID=MMETSP1061-20121228/37670_1 /TAXON_ID=37318 /ORGANISM="Pseudo-nitzschia pungens, Strain cf. pungens" /LENGTH=78 /DNA_ID=CAMNT_0013131343 /DNA_START=164 /DNA_END=400 /DNA_ORIENTATION=-
MSLNKSEGVKNCADQLESLCLCIPLWEFVLDDYDDEYYKNMTIRDRLREWNEERKYKLLKRKEDKKRENRRNSWASMV